MKLEKMNEQQIRCTLTGEDLRARHIKVSELAYGTDKARSLFKDMMLKAADELDFDAEDMPLMIEAVPMNSECIILTVTKVDDPEELDTRFARFAPELIDDKYDGDDDDETDVSMYSSLPGSSEITDIFNKLKSGEITLPAKEELNLVRLFSFKSLDDLMTLAKVIAPDYNGANSIYKDEKTGKYLLFLGQTGMDLMSFNRICNITSEYGESEKNLPATQAYLEEHYKPLINSDAIRQLSLI